MEMKTQQTKNSFFQKTPITCPVCDSSFKKEVLRFGKGRLIATRLQDDLRQSYKKTERFGEVYPLIYNAIVCPHCWFAALPEDFFIEEIYNLPEVIEQQKERRLFGRKLVPEADFTQSRSLETGMLSFFLALCCYSCSSQKSFSQAKKGISAMRASWCAHDLMIKYPDQAYTELKMHFRFNAYCYIKKHLELVYVAEKNKIQVTNTGPDIGNDYGFNGLVYLSSYLAFQFLESFSNSEQQYKALDSSRIFLSKAFGFGKSSKSSPSPLLGKSKNLYDEIKTQIDLLEKQGLTRKTSS